MLPTMSSSPMLNPSARPMCQRRRRCVSGAMPAISLVPSRPRPLHIGRSARWIPRGESSQKLADYEAVYRAFASGLAALYRPRVDKNIIAVVATLERFKTTQDAVFQAEMDQFAADNPGAALPIDSRPPNSVKATYRQLGKELGISSTETVGSRMRAALAEDVIEIAGGGPVGRTVAGTASRSAAQPWDHSLGAPSCRRLLL